MARPITFDDAKKLLQKGKTDGALLKDVDAFAGLVTFFAPLAVGLPPGTIDVIVKVLGEREALVKAGERLIERFAGIGAGDEVDKYRAIEASHLLISYSAFFDAVENEIPGFWKKLALDASVQKYLTERAKVARPDVAAATSVPPEIPHPLTTFESHLSDLSVFYGTLSQVIASYLDVLKIVDVGAAAKANEYAALKSSIVAKALERYQAQYVGLATTFPEFHIYANFHFQADVSDRFRALSDAALASRTQVDIGFRRLAEAIDTIGRQPAAETVADLRALYAANGQKAIYPQEIPGLTFPRRNDIFLPQAYRAVRYSDGMQLGAEATWSKSQVAEDLGPFLERCLESPHTLSTPILLLGQPGSGKSMLTHMIGSVLGGRFDTLRVELRSAKADARIHTQIEDFVAKETLGRHVSWPELQKQFTAPPVVILDGFDELLQATGKVFAAYLQDCAAFQTTSIDLGRPVRTIVTSRIALIGRAHIPEGTIVIRLEPFDAKRQREWVRIWNEHNASFFSDPAHRTSPFDVKPLSADIRDMAKQPLLLLMLAIYDTEQNPLAGRQGLNRTALYHNLVRSFIEREQRRLPDFENLATADQEQRIDIEMRRLGIAGLAMFNRRKREITSKEVDEALAAFDLSYSVAAEGQALGQAERLFDRFFFVTKSEAAVAKAGDTTYEFLHATFAEFLAAFTIAKRLVASCRTALAQTSHERQIYVKKPDALPSMWFECLMHAPIFSEPVVLAMLQEWMPQEAGDQYDDILTQLEEFVGGQALMLLEGTRFPDAFKTLPVQGHAAIYSANLVTIAVTLKGELVFDEGKFRTFPDEARPWDRMTHLWRSWFSLRVLANLGAALSARRDGARVAIRAKEHVEDVSSIEAGIERLYTAASGLGDHLLLGLSGYFLADQPRSAGPSLDEIDEHLKVEGYSIAPFTRFRRIPFEHGPIARQHLMSIALDQPIPNWEIWARAIWILTSEPVRSVNWASIEMVRELRNLTEPLIARVSGPSDCEAFFNEHSTRPSQLLFARRSGGRDRYHQTYQRVLASEASTPWTLDEQAMVLQAALYFTDEVTIKRLREVIGKSASRAINTAAMQTRWLGLRPQSRRLLTMFAIMEPIHELVDRNAGSSKASPFSMSAFAGWKSLGALAVSPILKTVMAFMGQSIDPQPNPYLGGYARYLRSASLENRETVAALRQLTTCVDLPADVRIELLDLLRKSMPAVNANTARNFEFPIAELDDVPFASVAAARRVAHWMGRQDALDAIDARLLNTR